MFKANNVWPDTQAARGTKFFAQSMRAFFDKASFEGFRAYSLDTLGRLREADAILCDIAARRVSEASLQPILTELIWSIENDAAAKYTAEEACETILSLLKQKSPERTTLTYAVRSLTKKLAGAYRGNLIQRVVSAINDDRRTEILTSVGYLVSHLINEGHNRDYIIWQLETRFFQKEVKKVGGSIVRAFLQTITEERRNWIVVRRVDFGISKVLKALEEWGVCQLGDLPLHAQSHASTWPGVDVSSWFISKNIEAADPFKATSRVAERLDEVKALRLLLLERGDFSWSNESYVYTSSKAKTGHHLISRISPLISTPVGKSNALVGRKLGQATGLAKRIYRNFDEISRERITRALSTGAVAMESSQKEIVLTSMWASIEALLGDPPGNDARIVHFVRTLSPCVCIRYHRRTMVAVSDYLKAHYRRKYKAVLYSEGNLKGVDEHTRFTRLVVLPRNAQALKNLLALISDDPLAVHRVWRLWKAYGEPSACRKTLQEHKQRVEWQMHRIYRVRNGLVHAGRSPDYTDTLILNASEYLRGAIISLARLASHSPEKTDIDQLIAEVGFAWDSLVSKLSAAGSKPFDEDLASAVFSPL